MNKLISRNPIQRFKQGRKLIKAQNGLDFPYKGNRIKLGLNAPSLNYTIPEINFPTDKIEDLPSIPPMPYPYKGKKVQIGLDTNIDLSPEKSLQKKKGRKFIDKDGSIYWLGSDGSKTLMSQGKSDNVNTQVANKNNSIQYRNPRVTTWQNKLKDFYEPGTFAADGIWGDNTEAAYQKYLQLVNVPEMSQEEAKAATTPRQVQFVNPVNLNSTPIQVPQTYNRTQVREFLRNKGVNPYDFSGNQRRAIRMILNGQGTDQDKALVQSMGIFKKGGQLPSRNPITRFRNRKSN